MFQCSAKDLSNVSEVFHYAQKAVLHPSSPLFNYEINEVRSFSNLLMMRRDIFTRRERLKSAPGSKSAKFFNALEGEYFPFPYELQAENMTTFISFPSSNSSTSWYLLESFA